MTTSERLHQNTNTNIGDDLLDNIILAAQNLKDEYSKNDRLKERPFSTLHRAQFFKSINSILDDTNVYKIFGYDSDIEAVAKSFTRIEHLFASIDDSITPRLKESFKNLKKVIDPVFVIIKDASEKSTSRDSEKIDNIISGRLKQLEQKQKNILSMMDRTLEQHQVKISDRERSFNITLNNKVDEANAMISSTQIDALNKITEKETELISSAAEIQQKINIACNKAEWTISNAANSSANTVKTILDEIKSECLTDMQVGIKKQIKIFSDAHKKLNLLLEVAGSDILSKDNLKQAEQERKEANFLRNVGFGFLVVAVIYIAIEVGLLVHGAADVTLEKILIRLIVTLVLMIPSAYLLKESARHRADERSFRKKGIHLATIDSYLANFDDASKLDVKRQLTANFFDNNDTVVDYSTVPDMNSSLVKLLEALVEKAKKEEPSTQYPKATPEDPAKK
ncbi:hypothetical protein [Aeromonas salmonicida]